MIGQSLAKRSDANDCHQDQMRHAGHCSTLSKPFGEDIHVNQVTQREDSECASQISERPEISISFEKVASARETSTGGKQAQPGHRGHGQHSIFGEDKLAIASLVVIERSPPHTRGLIRRKHRKPLSWKKAPKYQYLYERPSLFRLPFGTTLL